MCSRRSVALTRFGCVVRQHRSADVIASRDSYRKQSRSIGEWVRNASRSVCRGLRDNHLLAQRTSMGDQNCKQTGLDISGGGHAAGAGGGQNANSQACGRPSIDEQRAMSECKPTLVGRQGKCATPSISSLVSCGRVGVSKPLVAETI